MREGDLEALHRKMEIEGQKPTHKITSDESTQNRVVFDGDKRIYYKIDENGRVTRR